MPSTGGYMSGISSVTYSIINRSLFWIFLYCFGYFRFNLGICVFIAGVWYYISRKSLWEKKSKESKEMIKDTRQLLRHHLPAWVLHPDTERSEWVNIIMKQLWPNAEAYLRTILTKIETDPELKKTLEKYRICSMTFPSFSLGLIPPRITGVKVHSSVHRNEIIMDLNVDYCGDTEISLKAEVLAPFKTVTPTASVRDLTLKGQIRLHLSPLLKEKPFVGAVSVSFLEIPEVDFSLGGIAKVLDFPGIEITLKKFISEQLEKYIVTPRAHIIPLLRDDLNGKCLADFLGEEETHSVQIPAGVLTVKIIEAKGLINKDFNLVGSSNKSDPYAKLDIFADSVRHSFTTDVIPNNLHPVWNYSVDIPVDDPDSLDEMHISVWDKDSTNKDDFLGKCDIPLHILKTAITTRTAVDQWKILEDVQRGSVHVLISWSELKLHESSCSRKEENSANVGVLVLEIDSCSHLLGGRTGLKLPNPKIQAEICGISKESESVMGSVCPVFEHRMSFLVANPKTDTLKIAVVDSKKSSTLGTFRLDVLDLLNRTNLSMLNQQFHLRARVLKAGSRSPSIILSAAFRYIHSPITNGYGAHKSLQDLHKIMTSASKLSREIDSSQSDASRASSSSNDDNNNMTDEMNNNESATKRAMPDLISVSQRYDLLSAVSDFKPGSSGKNGRTPDYRAKIRISVKYSSKTKTLSVVIHQAKNLPIYSNSNVSVKLYLIEATGPNLNRRCRHTKKKTKHQKTPEPIFEETLEYFLLDRDLSYKKLEVSVEYSKNIRSKAIGRCFVDLKPLTVNCNVTKWYALHANQNRDEDFELSPLDSPKSKLKFSPTLSLKRFRMSDKYKGST